MDLMGDGRNGREYAATGVADLCRFHDTLRHEEVVKMIRGYDVLVVCSLAETFGVVAVAAIAPECRWWRHALAGRRG